MMKVNKNTKTWMLVVGGVLAVAASAYAAQRLRVYLAWREEEDYQENERKIEQYEDYVHSNGGRKRKRWWGGKQKATSA